MFLPVSVYLPNKEVEIELKSVDHIEIIEPTKISSFVCPVCMKTFAYKFQLNEHMNFHKPFKCDICLKGFTTRFNYKRHYLTHIE